MLALLGDALLLPVAVSAFATGLALAAWTPWGLLRHRWVVVKLVLTSTALVLTPFALLPGVRAAAALTAATPADRLADLGGEASGLVVASSVSPATYLACTALSVVKPWGRTRPAARESR
ncbi:hypothetical protein [Umezawaea beigongshangensis]|uniref:hypothetical protein n=1 Tax=Umezawaea beigongshangensis TaxID=2780383 RepID=UPI0018F1AEF5|nr:hypothetical protein [Umezawaea beigongshangensis]